jgi:hypothetical protein
MMSQSVYVIWAILLVVVILAVPLLVSLLQRTLNSARNIEQYLEQMNTAGVGIAQNTGHIKALESTIQSATTILKVAGDINSHAETVKKALAARVV